MDNLDLSWNKKFSIDFDLSKYTNMNEFIKKLNNKINDKTIETTILKIEQDYLEKIKYIEDLYYCTAKIKIIKTKNSLIILQKELEIIKILTKYTLQNQLLDYNFIKICLSLLLDFSEILRIRLGQSEIIHANLKKYPIEIPNNVNSDNLLSKSKNYSIARCSYKFCSYQDNCSYNYNYKSKNLCYQDHYVHNMVSADLKILLDYINDKDNIDNIKNIIHTKEILKTINTLSFVISHMECELRTKCLYVPENKWETFHIVKSK
jgi:hypothetical protein